MAWSRGKRCGKFNAVKTVVDGVRFDSKLEARRWNELLMLQRAKAITDLQRQVPFDLMVNGHHVTRYVADATYTEVETGERIVEDCKSPATLTPEFRIKAKLLEAIHGIVIQIHAAKPEWALDVNKGRWLRQTGRPRSRQTSARGGG